MINNDIYKLISFSYLRNGLSLKYLYVGERGTIQRIKTSGYWLTVEATANVTERAHLRVCPFLRFFFFFLLFIHFIAFDYNDNYCTSDFLYDTDSSNYCKIDKAYALLHIPFFVCERQSGSLHQSRGYDVILRVRCST